MAIRPTDQDTFYREVDEELRRERMNQLVARYKWPGIAALVLIIAAIGGFIWWQGRQETLAAGHGEALLDALDKAEAGDRRGAVARIGEVADSRAEGYRAAALFVRASAQAEAGDPAAALATLRGIAGNEDFAEPYRHAALVRQTALEYDRLPPRQVIQRLGPLARPGRAWFGSAGEMVALAHLRLGDGARAGQMFGRIARDQTVPPSIRTRAVQMAGALGVNAMPQVPANAAAPTEPAPTATREKTE